MLTSVTTLTYINLSQPVNDQPQWTCINLIQPVLTRINLIHNVSTSVNLSQPMFAKINLSLHVLTCINLSQPVLTQSTYVN